MTITLILTLLLFGATQPIQIQIEQPSIEACAAEVIDRLNHDPPDEMHPLIMGATCQKFIPKHENP